MVERVTIKVDKLTLDKVIAKYKDDEKENKGEYIVFFAKNKDVVVTCYKSKKPDEFKVMFLGEHALNEAKMFDKTAELNKAKEHIENKANWILLETQIGSDEVGTGDFFGPICVCAAYIEKKDIAKLRELGVDDSKRLNDEQIMELGKVLIKKIPYSQISLDNEKYNSLIDKGMNMNEIKCKMHNQVLKNLKQKYPNTKNIVVDQFLKEENYYKYLENEKEVIKGITFKTKGETYYPSVAVGSIIARYAFLQKMALLGEKYGVSIPFGASNKVTTFAQEFVAVHGAEALLKIVKKNFANLSEIL